MSHGNVRHYHGGLRRNRHCRRGGEQGERDNEICSSAFGALTSMIKIIMNPLATGKAGK